MVRRYNENESERLAGWSCIEYFGSRVVLSHDSAGWGDSFVVVVVVSENTKYNN